VQSSSVNCCWSSPAQSFLVSSLFGNHDLIYDNSNTIYVIGNGAPSSRRGGVFPFEYEIYFLCRRFTRVYPQSRSFRVKVFVPFRHHTHTVTLLREQTLCSLYTGHLSTSFCSILRLNLFYHSDMAVCPLNINSFRTSQEAHYAFAS
jgi:hypothetical protein